jgi:broad specificity phosphatase PhoE
MKWPSSITIVRHGQSTYNELREKKRKDPEYRAFCEEYERGPSDKLLAMAKSMQMKYALKTSDYLTPLSQEGVKQARVTGGRLGQVGLRHPRIIFVSPYLRTRQTLAAMIDGGFDASDVKIVHEDRIREQEHGLSLLYNDWRIFHSLHPEQRELRELMGPYWYQYPQGESTSNVRDRTRSFTGTMIRECAGMDVLLMSHHLTILSIRANYERLSPEEFIRLDEEEKPVNCGVTLYCCNPGLGSKGKLELKFYNKKLY